MQTEEEKNLSQKRQAAKTHSRLFCAFATLREDFSKIVVVINHNRNGDFCVHQFWIFLIYAWWLSSFGGSVNSDQ